MIYTNIKMAINSIRSTRTRSFLTMLGVIIGVSSVVVVVSLGQGVRNQVTKQINNFGTDVISIRPGRAFGRKAANQLAGINLGSNVATSTLTNLDLDGIKKVPGVSAVAVSSNISSTAHSYENTNYLNSQIIATSPETPEILNQKIEFGEFFGPNDYTRRTAVIGSDIAADLYNQRDPIGRIIVIHGEEYIVRGVFYPIPKNPLNIGTDFNSVVYIPLGTAKEITGNNPQISEIDVKVGKGQSVVQVSQNIKKILLHNHAGQEDFTIVKQVEYLEAANQVFNMLTGFVAAVAGISLLVGGIGIMNIMLVSVSERTREIGVRKAVGATNRQILGQFLIEAVVISVLGGIFGILLSLLTAFIFRLTTDFKPSLSFATILIATGVSTIVGVIFGMTPAIKASRKDPIQSLRHE
ncbi:ABC transporter permease [Candidatus Saccharibacteria bacterium]|jgi:putative ABC transport system permease protein|nr:ABC transporter permease [Candidatus Saccharibacteria bacterium]